MFNHSFPDEPAENWIQKSESFRDDNEIIPLMYDAIPESFAANLLKYNESFFSGKVKDDRTKYLLKANEINPDHPEIQDEMVLYYELKRDLAARKKQNIHWYELNVVNPGHLNYSYNLLNAIQEEEAIVLCQGDNDTYSLWAVQDVKDVKPHVHVLNIPLLLKSDYRQKIFNEVGIPGMGKDTLNFKTGGSSMMENQRMIFDHIMENIPENIPVYVGLTVYKTLYDKYSDDLYLTGLAFKYSKEIIDEIAYLKNAYDNLFLTDYLKEHFYYHIDNKVGNVNYIPGLIKLYEHYYKAGDQAEMDRIKLLIKSITKSDENWKKWYNETFND
ncbi:MAG: hypothetical protein C0594_05015 [Marinilabiliales bacterium]|nr:MAG: hypothetical protein C0594_05015 [Marinilabiliales bacterium]